MPGPACSRRKPSSPLSELGGGGWPLPSGGPIGPGCPSARAFTGLATVTPAGKSTTDDRSSAGPGSCTGSVGLLSPPLPPLVATDPPPPAPDWLSASGSVLASVPHALRSEERRV